MKIEIPAWLPLFPGFYDTIFDFTDDGVQAEELWRWFKIYDYPDCAELSEDRAYSEVLDMFNYDYKSWCDEVLRECTDWVKDELQELMGKDVLLDMKHDYVQSPREYNFTNDVGCCTYVADDEKLTKFVRKYLKEHADMWKRYLEDNFKSRPGFMSFHSHDPEEWYEEFEGYAKWDGNSTRIGAIFDFIVKNRNLENGRDANDYEAMYYSVQFPIMDYSPKFEAFGDLHEDVQDYVRQRLSDLDDLDRQARAYGDWLMTQRDKGADVTYAGSFGTAAPVKNEIVRYVMRAIRDDDPNYGPVAEYVANRDWLRAL